VRQLIAGPTVFICNECVAMSAEVLNEEQCLRELLAAMSADTRRRAFVILREEYDEDGEPKPKAPKAQARVPEPHHHRRLPGHARLSQAHAAGRGRTSGNMTDCQDGPPRVQRPGSGSRRATNGATTDSVVQAFHFRHGCRSRDVASNCRIRLKHQERCEVSSVSVIVNGRASERDFGTL
jgi:hypothetical protein